MCFLPAGASPGPPPKPAMSIIDDIKAKVKGKAKFISRCKRASLGVASRFLALAERFNREDLMSRAVRMKGCASGLSVHYCPECGASLGPVGFYCKDRFCPVCDSKRRKKMLAINLKACRKLLVRRYNLVMVTLTMANCEIKGLKGALSRLADAFHALVQFELKGLYEGYYRVLEITLKDGEAHPHYHVIFAVKGNFLVDKRELTEMWKRCLGVDYDPINFIQLVKGGKKRVDRGEKKVMGYLAKYLAKDQELEVSDDDDMLALVDALKGKRLYSYGGVLRELKKEVEEEFEYYPHVDPLHFLCLNDYNVMECIALVLSVNGEEVVYKDMSEAEARAVVGIEVGYLVKLVPGEATWRPPGGHLEDT